MLVWSPLGLHGCLFACLLVCTLVCLFCPLFPSFLFDRCEVGPFGWPRVCFCSAREKMPTFAVYPSAPFSPNALLYYIAIISPLSMCCLQLATGERVDGGLR